MRRALWGVLALLIVLTVAVIALNFRDESAVSDALPTVPPGAEVVARGEYLARAGNCVGCHSERGGAAYAGGRGIETPFGAVYAPNLTPDVATGIGNWSADHFWRALHNGRSRDGRLLYPAFPYTNYTSVTREDSDAIYVYLRSLPPVAKPNRAHDLSFPFSTQAALAVWRALYFRPAARPEHDTRQSAEWNRGAYLVQGLGHCNACHASRNVLGATAGPLDLGGGLIPMQNWYAPSLSDPHEAGVAQWPLDEIVALLKTGVGPRASVLGPMAEVVGRSTQHLSDGDLRAIAVYLKALPASTASLSRPDGLAPAGVDGARVYRDHCAQCHGEQGEGVPGAFPALAGNRAVTMALPTNLVRVVLEGGYAPSTAGNPRPHGMPPYGSTFSSAEVAAVLSYIRGAWGNRAAAVSELEVNRYR